MIKKTQTGNIKAFVLPFVDESSSDAVAKDKAVAYLAENAEAFQKLAWPLIRSAIWAAILEVRRTRNSILLASPAEKVHSICGSKLGSAFAAGETNQRRRAVAFATSLFDRYTLPCGTRLGDATYDVLMAASRTHGQNADGNAAKERWTAEMAKALPNRTTKVRAALTEAQALKLARKTKVKGL